MSGPYAEGPPDPASRHADRRCPSCDHLTEHHQPEGCWYTVSSGRPGANLVCPCDMPATEPTGQPRSTTADVQTYFRQVCAAELRVRVRRMTSALIAVEHNLDQPYPDDPRWTPWSRFVEPELKALRSLAARWPADPSQDAP